MAVREDRIQFLGSSSEILSYAGPQTRKIDLKGRTVVPGIINTHTHLHNGAVNRWANGPGLAWKGELPASECSTSSRMR